MQADAESCVDGLDGGPDGVAGAAFYAADGADCDASGEREFFLADAVLVA